MATMESVKVPTGDELFDTEARIGDYLSDLDSFVSRLGAREKEDRFDDIDQLTRVVTFATAATDDADRVRELAQELRRSALSCFFEARDSEWERRQTKP